LAGQDVICLDNLYTGSKYNIADLLGNINFEFIRHDITYPIHLEVDEIYNLACPASPIHYQKDPVQTIKTNVNGSINLLQLAKENNAKILQASTSEVYGDPEFSPQSEDYLGRVNFNGPRSCYDEGKRCAETLFFDYHRQYKIQIKIARIFNTFGPSMSILDGRVVSNFIIQSLKNEDITIYGDGCQTRSFCYVSDLVSGLIALMDSSKDITGPVNLGNDHEISMLNLAEIIIDLAKSKSKLVFFDLPVDDPKHRKPDLRKAKSLLGWNAKIEVIEGLKSTIEYFREVLSKI
jgi:UDP-glucuronate decarboxylase